MPRNIELKARLVDLDAARRTAVSLGAAPAGIEHQVDTYFAVSHGRLKLREINDREARLVGYVRPNDLQPKASDYTLVPVAEPLQLKELLSSALGVVAVVEKRREIFLWRNVRIHLDRVVGLGTFLEFEAVLAADESDEAGRRQVAELRAAFGITDGDLLAASYADLLWGKSPVSG
jgi:adenylate cyclase class 2